MSKKLEDKLKLLAEYRATRDEILSEYMGKRAKILEDAQPRLDALNARYKGIFADTQNKLNNLEVEIKILALNEGQTVRTDSLMAVFQKGRESLDSDFVTLCEEMHPEIALYRTTGLPSVSIKEIVK
jgi:hypothetical protein